MPLAHHAAVTFSAIGCLAIGSVLMMTSFWVTAAPLFELDITTVGKWMSETSGKKVLTVATPPVEDLTECNAYSIFVHQSKLVNSDKGASQLCAELLSGGDIKVEVDQDGAYYVPLQPACHSHFAVPHPEEKDEQLVRIAHIEVPVVSGSVPGKMIIRSSTHPIWMSDDCEHNDGLMKRAKDGLWLICVGMVLCMLGVGLAISAAAMVYCCDAKSQKTGTTHKTVAVQKEATTAR